MITNTSISILICMTVSFCENGVMHIIYMRSDDKLGSSLMVELFLLYINMRFVFDTIDFAYLPRPRI